MHLLQSPMNTYNLQQRFYPVGDTIALAIYLFNIKNTRKAKIRSVWGCFYSIKHTKSTVFWKFVGLVLVVGLLKPKFDLLLHFFMYFEGTYK